MLFLRSLSLLLIWISFTPLSSQSSIVEKLGYDSTARLLILHADDLGLSHAQNQASIAGFEKDMVNSGSIMVPCPWFSEIAAYARQHPEFDLGIHLTLTSEWKHYKWGPVAPRGAVSSLVDSMGYFHLDCNTFAQYAKLEEVEIELRAQIEKTLTAGIKITHLDTHMGCLVYSSAEIFQLYLQLGREYQLPVLLDVAGLQLAPAAFRQYIDPKQDVILDRIHGISPAAFEANRMAEAYTEMIRQLTPGIHTILLHLAYDNAEMQGVCVDHPLWGATWRQRDYDFFTSEACRQLLAKEGIQLVTWAQIKSAMEKD